MTARVLIAGCGDVGSRLGRRLVAAGHVVHGLRRNVAALPAELLPLAADLSDRASLDALPTDVDRVVYAAAATASTDDAYRAAYVDGVRNLLHAFASRDVALTRFVLASSTGVFSATDGTEVDEETATPPTGDRQDALLEGEALVHDAPCETVVVRLSGLYGPGRTRLTSALHEGRARPRTPPFWTNRIHVDDAARALEHALFLDDPPSLLLASDDEPATDADVYAHVARCLGIPAPTPTDRPSPRGRGRRISNARLRATGFSFEFPTYRDWTGWGAADSTMT